VEIEKIIKRKKIKMYDFFKTNEQISVVFKNYDLNYTDAENNNK